MTSLSWLLYLAEASGRIGTLVGIAAVVGAVVTFVLWLIAFMERTTAFNDNDRAKAAVMAKLPFKYLPWLFGMFLVTALLPSKQTILTIAAVEIGNRAIQSESAQELGGELGEIATDSLRLVRKFLDDQLGEAESE